MSSAQKLHEVFFTIFCHSFVFSQLCAEVSEGLTNVSGLPVTASILSTAPCLPPGLSLSLTFIDSYRKVATGLCVTHAHTLYKGYSIQAIVSEVPLMFSITS